MENLLRTSCYSYLFVAVFLGIWILLFLKASAKKYAQSKVRKTLCTIVCCFLLFFWLYFFVCSGVYPVTLAYYEYNNDLTSKTTGVITNIEQKIKDRIEINIDDQKYFIVYSSQKHYSAMINGLNIGDTVETIYGERSLYIFEIYKADIR